MQLPLSTRIDALIINANARSNYAPMRKRDGGAE